MFPNVERFTQYLNLNKSINDTLTGTVKSFVFRPLGIIFSHQPKKMNGKNENKNNGANNITFAENFTKACCPVEE